MGSSTIPPRQFLHFMPGEIVFRVDHDYGQGSGAAGIIIGRLEARYNNHEGGLEGIIFSQDRIVTFDRGSPLGCWYRLLWLLWKILQVILEIIPGRLVPRLPRWVPTRYFSLVFAEVPWGGFDPFDPTRPNDPPRVQPSNLEDLVGKIKRLDHHAALPVYRLGADEARIASSRQAATISKQDVNPGYVGPVAPTLRERITHYVTPPPVLEVKAATFNWLAGAAPGAAIPTGGPGAQPQPPGAAISAGIRVPGLQIIGLGNSVTLVSPNIKVMVLDTRPQISSDDLLDCFKGFSLPDTPLIRWLSPNTPQAQAKSVKLLKHRNTTTAGDNLVAKTRPISKQLADWLNANNTGIDIRGHEYDMSPHGTFAADILCGVVEGHGLNLELEVIEVLSKWGVGTMETIIRGLKQVCDEALSGTSIIANCSFTIQIPRLKGNPAHEIPIDDASQAKFRDDLEVLLNTHDTEYRIVSMIQPIFDLLDKKGVWIVAAAGNDRNQGQTSRPLARYPAAHKHVIGISALSDRGPNVLTSAPYSDAADEPENDGFAVFGGDVDPANPTLTDPAKGMLGLYYTDIPDASGAPATPSSSTGYLALWSGTSFATPIITGALAVLRARGMNRDEAILFLQKLHGRKTVDGGKEEVVWVE
jgi:hypothetical protein